MQKRSELKHEDLYIQRLMLLCGVNGWRKKGGEE